MSSGIMEVEMEVERIAGQTVVHLGTNVHIFKESWGVATLYTGPLGDLKYEGVLSLKELKALFDQMV